MAFGKNYNNMNRVATYAFLFNLVLLDMLKGFLKIAGDAATRSQDPWSSHIKLNCENDRKPTLFLLCVCGYAKYHIHVSMRYLTNFSNDTHGSNFANGECNHPRDGKSCQRIPAAKLAYYTHGLSQIPSQKRPTHFLVGCLLLCS